MTKEHYIVDVSIPGLSEAEVAHLAKQQETGEHDPSKLKTDERRDIGLDRDAA